MESAKPQKAAERHNVAPPPGCPKSAPTCWRSYFLSSPCIFSRFVETVRKYRNKEAVLKSYAFLTSFSNFSDSPEAGEERVVRLSAGGEMPVRKVMRKSVIDTVLGLLADPPPQAEISIPGFYKIS